MEFQPVLLTTAMVLFSATAIFMLLAPLVIGKFLRPAAPNREKDAIYECGEPTIGSSNIQFDLRFYVVALLFIVFDVEVAFFFPWAVVFGKANTLANEQLSKEQRRVVSEAMQLRPDATPISSEAARQLMWISLLDLLVFFGVVLVGFAYVWKRGDLDWVRALAVERAMQSQPPTGPPVTTATSVSV